jgi:hypothetical protein
MAITARSSIIVMTAVACFVSAGCRKNNTFGLVAPRTPQFSKEEPGYTRTEYEIQVPD